MNNFVDRRGFLSLMAGGAALSIVDFGFPICGVNGQAVAANRKSKIINRKVSSDCAVHRRGQDLAELWNLCAERPQKVAELKELLEKYKRDGRSRPGAPQRNDVPLEVERQKERKQK